MAATAPLLRQTLARASRRVRFLLALRHATTGVLAGALLSVLLLPLARDFASQNAGLPAEALALPPLLGLLAGACWGLARRVPLLEVARLTEQRLDLKERLSTAVALLPHAQEPIALRQIADAEAHAARGLDLGKALPLRIGRRAWAALAAVLALALAWLLPALPHFQSPAARAERAAVRQEGERLVRIAKEREIRAGATRLEATRRAARQMEALGREMQRGRMNRQKALMKTAELTERIRQSQQALAQEASKSLPAAARELEKAPAMRAAQKALGNDDPSSLAEQLSRLAEQAQQDRPGDGAQREKRAQQMGALAKALQGTRLEKASPDLQKAGEAMQKGDLPEAAKPLGEAARKIEGTARGNADAQSLQQMAEALQAGKDGRPKDGHVHTAECTKPGGT